MKHALEPIGRTIILPGCQPTEVGLKWEGDPTEEQLEQIDYTLQRCEKSAAWWNGDFLCMRIDRDMAAEAKAKGITWETDQDRTGRMRDAVRRYAQARDREEFTCRQHLGVANMFPLVSRLTSLSFKHHAECWGVGMTLDEARVWLDRAVSGNWSASKLRGEINAARSAHEDEEPKMEDDIPRECTAFERWAAVTWADVRTFKRDDARRILGEMPTAVRLVHELERLAALDIAVA